jgi:hypothetical protein
MTDNDAVMDERPAADGSAGGRRGGDFGSDPQSMPRSAIVSAAEEARVWSAIESSADSAHWAAVLELIDQYEFDLDPWRMTPLRVRALIELGWRRRALAQLVKAYDDGYVRGYEMVERLVEWRALALAADFIDGAMSIDLWCGEARALVLAAATRACAVAGAHETPLPYADAIEAHAILRPGQEPSRSGVDRALRGLTAAAADHLARGEAASAVPLLAAAARLAPGDRALLERLADAALRARLPERHLDTLLRIWAVYRDTSALLAAARGVLETSSWAMITEVMAIVATESGAPGLDIEAVGDRYRELAWRKVDEFLRVGDIAAGLDLAVSLSRQFPYAHPQHVLLSRLLRDAKRTLRAQRSGGEALTAALGPLYLELAPGDVDVCRMMARVLVRRRRLNEAREMLGRIVSITPHVASDWAALAMVQLETAEPADCDLSVARAVLIAPDDDLPPALAAVRERIGLA